MRPNKIQISILVLTFALVVALYGIAVTATVTLSPQYRFKFYLPATIYQTGLHITGVTIRDPAQIRARVGEVIDERITTFLVQCRKWQVDTKCDSVVARYSAEIVNDYTFRCGQISFTGLCGGVAGKKVKVILYQKINTNSVANCPLTVFVRDRQAMYLLSGRNVYWLNHSSSVFCGDPGNLLPTLVHELCHAFGKNLGHVGGREECQPIR